MTSTTLLTLDQNINVSLLDILNSILHSEAPTLLIKGVSSVRHQHMWLFSVSTCQCFLDLTSVVISTFNLNSVLKIISIIHTRNLYYSWHFPA